MSFSLAAAGPAPAAARAIADQPSWVTSDTSQLDRVKAFLAEELAAVAPGVAVLVEAFGHDDQLQHSVTITIRHITLAQDIPAEPDAQASLAIRD